MDDGWMNIAAIATGKIHLYYFCDSHREDPGHEMSNGRKDRYGQGPP